MKTLDSASAASILTRCPTCLKFGAGHLRHLWVETDAELPVGLFHNDQGVDPVCWLHDPRDDLAFLHLVQLFLQLVLDGMWYAPRMMADRCGIFFLSC